MRGSDGRSGSLFSYVDLESRVRADHPLRAIRLIVNDALAGLSAEFEGIYVPGIGRPSTPPERLLRALLLQAFYGIRSERQMVERLDHDLLFRWFVGLGVDGPVWDQTTFGKNRDRLLAGDVAHKFLAAVLAHPKVKRLLSGDHFSVDGTIIEAWASMKSVRSKDGSGEPPAPGRNGEDATVKRFHYDDHEQLRRHLTDFVAAYNFGRRLKTLKGLTPYEFICKRWTTEPSRFTFNPIQKMPGLNMPSSMPKAARSASS